MRVRRLLGLAAAALSVLPSASGWRASTSYGDGGGEAITGVDENGKNRTDDGTRFCSWDPLVALEMAFDYPWPSGDDFPLTIPNDATPGGDLTLTVVKDEDPYKFKVPPGGFGGRVMICDMPKVPDDDEFAMMRARPICHVAEPAKMDCKTSDFFSTGKVSVAADLPLLPYDHRQCLRRSDRTRSRSLPPATAVRCDFYNPRKLTQHTTHTRRTTAGGSRSASPVRRSGAP